MININPEDNNQFNSQRPVETGVPVHNPHIDQEMTPPTGSTLEQEKQLLLRETLIAREKLLIKRLELEGLNQDLAVKLEAERINKEISRLDAIVEDLKR